jgi:elongation factor Ts
MFTIMMEQIKKLREQTGAGMVDCQKALKDAENDFDKAVDLLRKKGMAKAAKRSDREASEGVILVDTSSDNKKGYIVEINSETDFVAKNEQFQNFSKKVLELIKEKNPSSLEDLMSLNLDQGTVSEELENLSGVIGEKLQINNFAVLEGETVAAYSHLGGKIGVVLALDQPDREDLAKEMAMQVAATNPPYVSPEDVPEEEVNKEKEIYKEQLLKEGKTEDIIEKILVGKVNKYYEDVCLVKQEYIKEDKKKIEEVLDGAKIVKFIRFSL